MATLLRKLAAECKPGLHFQASERRGVMGKGKGVSGTPSSISARASFSEVSP